MEDQVNMNLLNSKTIPMNDTSNNENETDIIVKEVHPNAPAYYMTLDRKLITNNYMDCINKCFPHIELHKQQTINNESLINIANQLQIISLNRIEKHMRKK